MTFEENKGIEYSFELNQNYECPEELYPYHLCSQGSDIFYKEVRKLNIIELLPYKRKILNIYFDLYKNDTNKKIYVVINYIDTDGYEFNPVKNIIYPLAKYKTPDGHGGKLHILNDICKSYNSINIYDLVKKGHIIYNANYVYENGYVSERVLVV